MDTPQRNKLSMYLAVLGVMETYQTVWQPLPAISDQVNRLTGFSDAIQSNSGVQGTPRTGIAKGKNRKQMEMIDLAIGVAGDLHSFAQKQGNDVLAGQTDVKPSDLVRTPDNLVAARCREIQQMGVANATGITSYGTTAADLTALATAIDAYEPLATAPRQATVAGKGVTENIATDITSADQLLKTELDKAMRKFQRKNPDFAHAYANARIIVDLGGGGGSSAKTPAPAASTTTAPAN